MNHHTIIYQHIEKGEFSEASNIIGELLEKNPDDIDFISGYYAIRYWQNRERIFYQLSRKSIALLLEEWKKFEHIINEKGFRFNAIIIEIKRFLMKKSIQKIYNKLNQEGLEEKDLAILLELAKQLLSIYDFKSAKEMLSYCQQLQQSEIDNVLILFLFGDALCLEAEITNQSELYPEGLSLIRDGFLIDANQFPIKDIQSKVIKNTIKELNFLYRNQTNKIQIWLPIHLMLKSFYPDIRKLNPEEISDIEEEIQRLEEEIHSVPKKFYEKTLARLIFYYLVVIHALIFHYTNEERLQEVLTALEFFYPKVYKEVLKLIQK